MSGLRWLANQYFQLPRWERIGVIFLLLIILVFCLATYLWPTPELTAQEMAELNAAEKKVLDQLKDYQKKKNELGCSNDWKPKKYSSDAGPLKIDDIHQANPSQLIGAGLSKKVAFNLYNYIKKGGRIKSWKDVSKIYGMTNEMMSSLSKHVTLDSSSNQSLTAHNSQLIAQDHKLSPAKKSKVDLNTADSSQLASVYGISPKMAAVIIRYRTKIFAFHSVEQLNEMFKDPLKNFETIKEGVEVKNFKPCIPINTISLEELKKHQYFKKDNLAAGIISYRDKHGSFRSASDLKKCVIITDEVLTKILPYIAFE